MKIILIAALFCLASWTLPRAHAQQDDAVAKPLTLLRAEAEQGVAQSQFELSKAYYSGQFGLATKYVEAVKWLRKAAEKNHAKAQYNLGVFY